MKVESKFQFLGYKEGKTKDDKPWFQVSLLQDLDVDKMFISDKDMVEKLKNIKAGSICSCLLNISTYSDKTYINLDDISVITK